jgi:hypothetical protein
MMLQAPETSYVPGKERASVTGIPRTLPQTLLVCIFLGAIAFAQAPSPLPTGNSGIASKYPGDVNIKSDPAVLFADDFESYTSASQLTSSGNWQNYYGTGINTAIETGGSDVFAGSKSLRFIVPANSGDANAVQRTLAGNHDTVFLRAYTKFASDWSDTGSEHNGITLMGNYCGPGTTPSCNGHVNPPGSVGAGRPSKMFVNAESSCDRTGSGPQPCFLNSYVYYPEQRDTADWYGDHWFPDGYALPNSSDQRNWGPYFQARANWVPVRNQWYCYEIMVQLNTVGSRNGRVAVWVDGKLMADYQNLVLRSDPTLHIDDADLQAYIQNNTGPNMRKWYDNVVVATSYIGPMGDSSSGTVAPPTGLTAIAR